MGIARGLRCVAVLAACCIFLASCKSTTVDPETFTEPTNDIYKGRITRNTKNEVTKIGEGNIASCYLRIGEVKAIKDRDGGDGILVEVEWTNKSSSALSYSEAFIHSASQDGKYLSEADVTDSRVSAAMWQSQMRPGDTAKTYIAFKLNDSNAPVSLEFFNPNVNEAVLKKIEPAKLIETGGDSDSSSSKTSGTSVKTTANSSKTSGTAAQTTTK